MEEKDNMKKKEKRPIYEPPKAVDLSDSSVSGQELCFDGGTNTNGCIGGLQHDSSPTN
jgi:hypothetical protein